MLQGKLGRRYAKALFELAHGREEAVAEELDNYLEACANSDLNKVVGNPAFPVGDRKAIALEVAQQLGSSDSVRSLVAILVEKDRMGYLPSITAYYHGLLDDSKGRVNARVIVPAPLTDAEREQLAQLVGRLSGKKAVLREQIDPSIIGGVIIEVRGTVYDGSVRTQLEGLRQNIERTL